MTSKTLTKLYCAMMAAYNLFGGILWMINLSNGHRGFWFTVACVVGGGVSALGCAAFIYRLVWCFRTENL